MGKTSRTNLLFIISIIISVCFLVSCTTTKPNTEITHADGTSEESKPTPVVASKDCNQLSNLECDSVEGCAWTTNSLKKGCLDKDCSKLDHDSCFYAGANCSWLDEKCVQQKVCGDRNDEIDCEASSPLCKWIRVDREYFCADDFMADMFVEEDLCKNFPEDNCWVSGTCYWDLHKKQCMMNQSHKEELERTKKCESTISEKECRAQLDCLWIIHPAGDFCTRKYCSDVNDIESCKATIGCEWGVSAQYHPGGGGNHDIPTMVWSCRSTDI